MGEGVTEDGLIDGTQKGEGVKGAALFLVF